MSGYKTFRTRLKPKTVHIGSEHETVHMQEEPMTTWIGMLHRTIRQSLDQWAETMDRSDMVETTYYSIAAAKLR